jgi:hypothetical protein
VRPATGRRRQALPALILALVVLALGLTTYTQSVFNPGPAQTLEEALQQALGDSLPTVPAYDASRTGLPISAGTAPSDAPSVAPSVPADSASRWVADAVRRDSSAIRAWLSPLVLRWASRNRDTVRLTFVRLTHHSGCPLVSRLDATLSDEPFAPTRLVRVTATCPAH